VDRLNRQIPERDRWLKIPDIKFNRKIGRWAHEHYDVDGNEISADKFDAYLTSVTPSAADYRMIDEVTKDSDWIEARQVSPN
jgi:hypothetical protein